MKFNRCLELLKEYNECHCCGNNSLEDGEGTLEIDECMFIRTCKCGWEVKIEF